MLRPSPDDPATLVRLAFEAALRRAPSNAELATAIADLGSGALSVSALLQSLIGRQEFAVAALRRRGGSDDRALSRATPAVVALAERLRARDAIDRARFEQLWHERFHVRIPAGIGEDRLRAYGELHKERFWETANSLCTLLAGRAAPRLLDFGMSVFMWFYQHLLPGVELVTSDRPVDPAQDAFFRHIAADAGSREHVPVDLTDPAAWTDEVRERFGRFDAVVLTEVLEHITVHPVHVLRAALGLLRDHGFLYITTPNFFSRVKLGMVLHRRHPQDVFPLHGNADAAHHFREGVMGELLEFVEAAGGRALTFYWSDCWDVAHDPDLQPPEERSNLVVVAARRD